MRSLLGALAATTLAFAPASLLSASEGSCAPIAMATIEAAPAKGEIEAISALAWRYETGSGVAEDDARAASLYRAAAARGEPLAQWRLGVMIDEGSAAGSAEDAVALFRGAAAQKSAAAMASLAVMHATGRGVERDYEAAMRYYQAAARMGSAHGIQGIGVLHANGQGVERDMDEALAYWLVAAAAGNGAATTLVLEHMPASGTGRAGRIYARASAIADAYGLPAGEEEPLTAQAD